MILRILCEHDSLIEELFVVLCLPQEIIGIKKPWLKTINHWVFKQLC